jgi:hypothetical protein
MSKTDGWVVTRTDMEKLYDIFLQRYQSLWGEIRARTETDILDVWEEWLRGLEGVEHIRKFSNMAESIDYLLEEINKPGWDRVVIRDPGSYEKFIIVERDFAEKVLVLGVLP